MFLSLSNLSVGYRNRTILHHLNLSADECELVALIGRNGAGKSTLIRTIARLQPALSGGATIAGKPLDQYTRTELAGLLSFVSTEPVNISHLTVRQLVSFGRFPHTNWIGKLTTEDIALVEEAMHLVGITSLGDRNLYEISDGERQRAMIARTLAQNTKLILLDEPTAFLDMSNKYEVIHLLHHLTRTKRKTILFSTHDLDIAMQEADKLWLMVDNILYEGAPEDLVLNHQLARIFEGTELHFDDCKGVFNIRRKDIRLVSLSGKGKLFFWTKKALERLGFLVREHENDKQMSISVSETASPLWTVNTREEELHFHSIYELSKFLSACNR